MSRSYTAEDHRHIDWLINEAQRKECVTSYVPGALLERILHVLRAELPNHAIESHIDFEDVGVITVTRQ